MKAYKIVNGKFVQVKTKQPKQHNTNLVRKK